MLAQKFGNVGRAGRRVGIVAELIRRAPHRQRPEIFRRARCLHGRGTEAEDAAEEVVHLLRDRHLVLVRLGAFTDADVRGDAGNRTRRAGVHRGHAGHRVPVVVRDVERGRVRPGRVARERHGAGERRRVRGSLFTRVRQLPVPDVECECGDAEKHYEHDRQPDENDTPFVSCPRRRGGHSRRSMIGHGTSGQVVLGTGSN